jgi:hypothetical protein
VDIAIGYVLIDISIGRLLGYHYVRKYIENFRVLGPFA